MAELLEEGAPVSDAVAAIYSYQEDHDAIARARDRSRICPTPRSVLADNRLAELAGWDRELPAQRPCFGF